jgi:hypothetical protein
LFLKIFQTASKTLYLVLVERFEGKPDNLDEAVFQEDYRDDRLDLYNKTFLARMAAWTDEGERKAGSYLDYGIEELARFRLEEGINAKKVAQRVVTEAQKIHAEQTEMAKERRKKEQKERQGLAKTSLSDEYSNPSY